MMSSLNSDVITRVWVQVMSSLDSMKSITHDITTQRKGQKLVPADQNLQLAEGDHFWQPKVVWRTIFGGQNWSKGPVLGWTNSHMTVPLSTGVLWLPSHRPDRCLCVWCTDGALDTSRWTQEGGGALPHPLSVPHPRYPPQHPHPGNGGSISPSELHG